MDIRKIEKKPPIEIPYHPQDNYNTLFSDPQKRINLRRSNHQLRKRLLFFGLLVVILLGLSWGIFVSYKAYSASRKITIHNSENSLLRQMGSVITSLVGSSNVTLEGEKEGRINILLLGAAGEGKSKNLTDTVMIASVDTRNKKVAFLSLPRDLYVKIPSTSHSTKINSVYQYGLREESGTKPIVETVEQITGLNISYYLIIDFDGFIKIIDDIGGIEIEVERDIFDTRYPGPNYSYETFELKKGWHHLDGPTTLKYVRERHADPEGDFGRAKRQQKVIQAVKNKVFSKQTFLNVFTFNRLMNTLGDSLKTNITLEEAEKFIELSKKVDTQNISNVVVDAWKKDSLLKVSHIMVGPIRMFILVPRIGNYSEISELAENIFDLELIRIRKQAIRDEKATIALINQSGDKNLVSKIKNLLEAKMELEPTITIPQDTTMLRDKTVVYDNTDGKKIYTLDELVKRLPAELASEKNDIINLPLEKKGLDLVIVLGSDLQELYALEEDSLEDFKNSETSNQEDLIE